MKERRKATRREKLVRNLYSYLNRRNLLKKGRRKNEDKYRGGPDWFDRETAKKP